MTLILRLLCLPFIVFHPTNDNLVFENLWLRKQGTTFACFCLSSKMVTRSSFSVGRLKKLPKIFERVSKYSVLI